MFNLTSNSAIADALRPSAAPLELASLAHRRTVGGLRNAGVRGQEYVDAMLVTLAIVPNTHRYAARLEVRARGCAAFHFSSEEVGAESGVRTSSAPLIVAVSTSEGEADGASATDLFRGKPKSGT